ncbi:hypothetical protein T01_12773 [Trichinella spiralis]|uniref:Uncharacterized protein n=1 Tax=Trichinella spiralis TaxID=6334 RepID=A0A0V1BCL5_TRISP|nr:hypothetical protein T01_12773 [Trichinella spiralis]
MTFLSAVSGQLISHSAARFEQAALVSKCFPNKEMSVKVKGNYNTSLKSVTNRYDHLKCVCSGVFLISISYFVGFYAE